MTEKENNMSQREIKWRGWASETVGFSNKNARLWKALSILSLTYSFIITMTLLLGIIYVLTNFDIRMINSTQDGETNYNVVDSTGVDFGAESNLH